MKPSKDFGKKTRMLESTWKVCFIPLFEEDNVGDIRIDDADFLCLGVSAEKMEDAIAKLRDQMINEDLSEYIGEEEGEEWKGGSSNICKDIIVVAAQHLSTVDIK
jgi:hypothetical protein